MMDRKVVAPMGSQNNAGRERWERRLSDAEAQRRRDSEVARYLEKTSLLVPGALRKWCDQMGILELPEVTVRNLGCILEGFTRRAKYQIEFTVNGLQFRGKVVYTDDRCQYKVRLVWPNGAQGPTITSVEALTAALAGAPG
jgi:hypothetical protein